MTRYLANLDFDSRLAGKAGGAQPRPGPPDENAVLLRLIAQAGDEVLVPGLPEAFDAPAVGPLAELHFRPPNMNGEADFTPWGVDVLAQRLSCSRITDEQLEIVALLNDRRFAWELSPLPSDTFAVPDAFFTVDPDEILQLANKGKRLMLKPRHGGFGRGLRRILGPESDDNLKGWVAARCREGGLVVEPLLDQIAEEWGTHWDIDADAHAIWRGQTALTCDEHGQFSASCFSSKESNFQQKKACLSDEISGSGYVGPLTVDECLVWYGKQLCHVGYRDINARWSVGRLILDAARHHSWTEASIERVPQRRSRREVDEQEEGLLIPPLSADSEPRWRVRFTARNAP